MGRIQVTAGLHVSVTKAKLVASRTAGHYTTPSNQTLKVCLDYRKHFFELYHKFSYRYILRVVECEIQPET
jgi:hypothetical protein